MMSTENDKSEIIREVMYALIGSDERKAKEIIRKEYPHEVKEIVKRSYTLSQRMQQFIKDGFIDRYSGNRLVNPGILKVISTYFPEEFPFQPHWKMTDTHIAYWELIPTLDHIYPIAKGGRDDKSNWVTTSMKNNSIKSNYTVEEIGWTLYPKGNMEEWDGLTQVFIELVENNRELLSDRYIKSWYGVSVKEKRKMFLKEVQ